MYMCFWWSNNCYNELVQYAPPPMSHRVQLKDDSTDNAHKSEEKKDIYFYRIPSFKKKHYGILFF